MAPFSEGSPQKRLDHPLSLRSIHIAGRDAEDIGFVVFGGQGGRFGVPGDGRTNPADFIRRHSHSNSGTADQNSSGGSA